MPSWDFVCEGCGHIERGVSSARCDVNQARPEHCGQKMETLWDNHHTVIESFEPFVTTHLDPDGKPIRVSSKRELSRLCSQYGVMAVDDPGLKMEGGELVRQKAGGKRVYFT